MLNKEVFICFGKYMPICELASVISKVGVFNFCKLLTLCKSVHLGSYYMGSKCRIVLIFSQLG